MKRALKYTLGTFLTLVVIAAAILGFNEFQDWYKDYYADKYVVRSTPFPATDQPDQVCLTWSGDPRTTQTIQWRVSTAVKDGIVQYHEGTSESTPSAEVGELDAKPDTIEDKMLKNDPVIQRYTAELGGLKPATTYNYRVGSKQLDKWSEWAQFTTAPEGPTQFSFNYLGDPQLGLDFWGKLINKAQEQYTTSAFYVIAGDLVNSGSWRNEWDRFFNGGKGVFEQRPIIPILGNHDYDKKKEPKLYLQSFALAENGPPSIGPERAYSFTYGNALFVVMDSNRELEDQTPWLEEQLAGSNAVWKFVAYHHPAYSSAPHRDNRYVRKTWGALFDKYHVDIALQGHDHAYLRTFPLRAGKRVDSPKDGTIYIVSVSGTKYYEQEDHDYAEVAFANISTYQIIDITTNPNRLTYRSYDLDGAVKDEFVIEK